MKKIIAVFMCVTMLLSLFVAVPVNAVTKTGINFSSTVIYRSKRPVDTIPKTFEAWINLPTSITGRGGIIAGNYTASTPNFNFEVHEDGVPMIWWSPEDESLGDRYYFDQVKVNNGQWTHLAVSIESNVLKCYVNGSLKQTVTATVDDYTNEQMSAVNIGSDNRSGNTMYFKGSISSVSMFSNARTATEIASDMNSVPTSNANLIGHYDFSVSGNNRLKDYSPLANHLYYYTPANLDNSESYLPQASASAGIGFSASKLYSVSERLIKPVYTYEATIYLPTSVTGRAGVIFSSFNSGANPMVSFEVNTNGNPRLYVSACNNTGSTVHDYVFTDVHVNKGKWLNLAISRNDSNQTINCYVDGFLRQSLPMTTSYAAQAPNGAYGFGGDYRASNAQYFQGRILKAAMYSDQRSAAEIRDDILTLNKDNLLVCYDTSSLPANFTEIPDLSGNNIPVKPHYIWSTTAPKIDDYDYSFAVVGDTQVISDKNSANFTKIYDWIVANAESKKMKHVFGLGDITERNSAEEWGVAMSNIQKMDSVVPYSLVRGNHDGVDAFNKFVTYNKYKGQLGSAYADKMTNTWREIRAGDNKYLLITLDFGASDDILNWASGVITAHPNHNIIITTHGYLFRDGTTIDAANNDVCPPAQYGGYNNGDHMWDKLIKKHPNICLVMSGHDPSPAVVLSQDKGEKGNTVSQLLIDPQGVDNQVTGGTGMVTMLYFSNGGKRVQVETYSTIQQKWYLSYNQFDFELDSIETNGLGVDVNTRYSMENMVGTPVNTFEAVISLPKTSTGRSGVIVGTYGSTDPCMSVEIYENGNPRVYISKASGSEDDINYIFTQVNVATNEWVHLTIVRYEDINRIRCFVNGVMMQSLVLKDTEPLSTSAPYCIGSDYRSNNEQYFKGRIKSVALYTDARTDEEILSDVTTLDYDNLCAYYNTYPYPDGADIIPDQSGNGNDLIRSSRWSNTAPELDDYAFSFAVVGDTQVVNDKYPDNFHCIYDYIINNAQSKKIKHVFGLGDITERDSDTEWARGMENIKRMNSVVPYSLVRGNHDSVNQFNKYITTSEFGSKVSGYYNNSMINSYQTLTVGNIKYLIMTLDFGPSDDVLAWANNVVASHPDHNVIITTHAYLFRDGTTLDENDVVPPTKYGGYNNGDDMWEKLVKKHENIVLVMSGHDPHPYVVTRQENGDNGNNVTQMLIDFQEVDKATDGGTGMVTMFYFSEDGKNVQVETYSTIRNQWFLPENQFKMTLDLVGDDIVYGDVNNDSEVTSADALKALQASVELVELTEDEFLVADVDGNDTLSTADALYILQYAVKKIDSFPIQKK